MSAGNGFRRVSPVRRVCKPGAFDEIRICKWECDGNDLRVAQFRAKSHPDVYAVLHRSTKQPGQWQFSTFDEQGAVGDVNRSSCTLAVNDGIDQYGYRMKLEHVVSRRHGQLAGARRRRR